MDFWRRARERRVIKEEKVKKVAPARKRESWRRERGEVREWDWGAGGSWGPGRGLLESDIPAIDCRD